jgi:hypothetical protein
VTLQLRFHPLSQVFPLIEGPEFEALVEDIRTNGQQDPILVIGDQIVDGRNRYRACQRLSIEPRVITWDGKGDLAQIVSSRNIHRRHLSASQKATIAVPLMEFFQKDAMGRMRAGRPAKSSDGPRGRSIELAGRALGISGRYVQMAAKLKKRSHSMFQEVFAGRLHLTTAVRKIDQLDRRRGKGGQAGTKIQITNLATGTSRTFALSDLSFGDAIALFDPATSEASA